MTSTLGHSRGSRLLAAVIGGRGEIRGWRSSRRFGPLRRHPRVSWAALVVVVVLIAVGLVAGLRASTPIRTAQQMITVTPEGTQVAQLDTTVFFPDSSTPAPAILLAHGLGGNKHDLDAQARALAGHGYVVMDYSARGFGQSTGLVHLDSPDYEVADAKILVSYLAALPQVKTTAPGDPVIGVAGGSYGGGLALLLAGYDPRIDAVAADITWNDLQSALFPNGALTADGQAVQPGVFKQLWTGLLFQEARGTGRASGSLACGRVAADVCTAFQQSAQDGTPDAATSALLRASSPVTIDAKITAPTLLTQGEQDSLFPLTEADANAREIAASGTPVRVAWRAGGHDGAGLNSSGEALITSWFDSHLRGAAANSSGPAARSFPFQLSEAGSALSSASGRRVNQTLRAAAYPNIAGAAAAPTTQITLQGQTTTVSAPAGGNPAAISSVPGLGSVLEQAATLGALSSLSSLSGQSAAFDSDPLTTTTRIAGASTVTLTVTPRTTTDATFFVSLVDVSPDGSARTPQSLVEPVRLTGLTPGVASTVTVRLPAVVTDVARGHKIRLAVSTTDEAYQLPNDPREYRIGLAANTDQLTVVGIDAATLRTDGSLPWLITGLVALLLSILSVVVRRLRRRRSSIPVPELLDTPISVRGLVKEYADGYRAVDDLSFTVERGQVVGLLGPNGAGKTTALRVLVGLIQPTKGEVHVFGRLITPGAPVLSRLGAFIEGPGFLPHLSGYENLTLFWAASGRDAELAHLDTALEIAGLGESVHRRVKTYSQGMRQRLAIAQAMLGLPELLVLDEPTNGLDPPQIAEMREVLKSYAETGRTVVVSSHLLAEVEMTCSHVVVMHQGRLVAAGSVADVAGSGGTQLAVDDPLRAAAVLADAGILAEQVPVRRALEDVFLDLIGR